MLPRALVLLFILSPLGFAGDKPANGPQPMTSQTRMQMIRLLNAEYVFARKPFPMGQKGLTIRPDGKLSVNDSELYNQLVQKGTSAKAGERVQITSVNFDRKAIILEVNGGPVKKRKWYQRIQVSGPTGATAGAPEPDQMARGSFLRIEFKDYVPEMTLADLKQILDPIFDFSVKSAAQAYTETLPENVRNAIRDHQVLVGMSKEMVAYAKGRPPQRIRERDDKGQEYEEWIYGQAPADVEFVRFVGDEVIQLKIMRTGTEKIVKTEREVNIHDPAIVTAATAMQRQQEREEAEQKAAQGGQQKGPSLRRPGEQAPARSDTYPGSVPPVIVQPQDPPQMPPKLFVADAAGDKNSR